MKSFAKFTAMLVLVALAALPKAFPADEIEEAQEDDSAEEVILPQLQLSANEIAPKIQEETKAEETAAQLQEHKKEGEEPSAEKDAADKKDSPEKIEGSEEKKSEENKDLDEAQKKSGQKKKSDEKKKKKKFRLFGGDDEKEQNQDTDSSEPQSEQKYNPRHFPFVKEYSEREEVLAWKEKFLAERRFKVLKATIDNSLEYRIFVRKAVRDRELPPELEYLPVVESAYNPKAKSRSGALGMWQFMANSVRPYLKLTEYVDERLDPWKSTDAGLSKLEYNYKIFGDWLIAIAAYNCGNGKMTSAIKRAGTSDFWTLAEKGYIPRQTAEYIPQLIAVSEICENPEKFNVELPDFHEEYEAMVPLEERFDFVTVKKPYMLSSIAKGIDVEESLMKKLNPSLTKGFTPPSVESVLRLPKGKEEAFTEAIGKIKPLEFPFKYKVKKGDSLWSISRRYGVTVKALCDTNGIKENGILKINQILYIPGVK